MTLRARLTTLSVAVVVLALGVATVLAVHRTDEAFSRRGDEELAALASGLRGFAQAQTRRVEAGRPPLQYRALARLQLGDVFEGYAVVVQPDGTTLPLPRLARDGAGVPTLPPGVAERADGPGFALSVPGGARWRARVVSVPDSDAVLVVALSTSTLDRARDDLVRDHVLTAAVLVVLVALLAAASVRFGLRPLTGLTSAARDLANGSLGARVPPAASGTEVGDLTEALNQLLDAIDDAVAERAEQQRRTEQFSADAAHELRTPVAAIAGYADLYHQGGIGPADAARLDEVFGRIGREAERLADLVESLLVLNRLDHTGPGADGASDLAAIAVAVAADSMTIDPRHPVTVQADGPQWAALPAEHATRVVANLVANVRRHTPPGTRADIAIETTPSGRVRVRVSDDGPGVDPADRPHVFDRFHRGDPARHRTGPGGSGLGLAIVAAVAQDAGGQVTLLDTPAGATFEVVVPAASAGPA